MDAGLRPRLFIHKRCARLLDCLPAMQHDPNRPGADDFSEQFFGTRFAQCVADRPGRVFAFAILADARVGHGRAVLALELARSFSAIMQSGMQTNLRRCSMMTVQLSLRMHWSQRGSSKRVFIIRSRIRHLTPALSPIEAEREGQGGNQSSSGSITSDGGLWIVDVERAEGGDQLHESCAFGVGIANVEGNGNALHTSASAEDGEAQHPDDV